MTSDPNRRTLLAGGALALTATATAVLPPASGAAAGQAPPPAAAATASSPNAPLSAKDFGAIADGYSHPLSERFATLGEARGVYPFATALAQTLDWAAIQAAVNAVEGRTYRSVRLPAGHYVISDSIRLPNGIDFHGDGAGSTFLDNEVIRLEVPQIVNAAPSFVSVAIRNMACRGGTHALKVDVPNGEITWLLMDGVACAFQTDKNIECSRLLQSSDFNNCGFMHSPYGVYVDGHTTNAVNFRNCGFEQHTREHLHLTGAEGVNVHGGKFEGSGPADRTPGERVTISLENAGAVNFDGVYFEATHEILLKEIHSRGGVSFQGCHFTGASGPGGLIPYRFVSDGPVTFGTNDWYLPSEGPARILLQGYNQKLAAGGGSVEILVRSPRQQRSVSAGRAVPKSGVLPLAMVTRVGPAPTESALLTGDLMLHGTVRTRAGDTALLSRRYHLRLAATGTGTGIAGRIEAAAMIDDPGVDLAVRLRTLSAGASVLEAVLRGAGAATLQWSLDTITLATSDGARLEAEVSVG